MKPLLTAEELGPKLGLHPRTIMAMARRQEIPGSKIGRRWFFREDEVFDHGRPAAPKARKLVTLAPADRARMTRQGLRIRQLLGKVS